jgi:DNA-binding NtrC family response regulator
MLNSLAHCRILIIDDVPEFCREMRTLLRPVCGQVSMCTSPLRSLRLLRTSEFDLVITTLIMRELGGFELIRRLRGQGNGIPILMVTGLGNDQTAIEATRLGVSDYMPKPIVPGELYARIEKIFAAPAQANPNQAPSAPELLTHDPILLDTLRVVKSVAATDSRVLILGETGTGKQLIAQTLHHQSNRRTAPFVEVNCAAIPEALLESELFGHERGAFTGATERRIGRFEEAGEGTLFLDEIGEMNYNLQAKLLRVLQNGHYHRVGGTETLHSKARIVAATNRVLETEVQAGRFRADLYYRLQVITLTVPPLRDRPEDVPLLAQRFLERLRKGRPIPLGFKPEVLRQLKAYRWPGNVRELENVAERLAVLADSPWVELHHLPEHLRLNATTGAAQIPGHSTTYADAKRAFEIAFISQGLRAHQGNMAAAARAAGLDRAQYFRLVRRQKLNPADFR